MHGQVNLKYGMNSAIDCDNALWKEKNLNLIIWVLLKSMSKWLMQTKTVVAESDDDPDFSGFY